MQWSVAIFSSRETLPTLSSSIEAILSATNEAASVVDVMVDGNQGLANDVGRDIVGDKAHALESIGTRHFTPIGDYFFRRRVCASDARCAEVDQRRA